MKLKPSKCEFFKQELTYLGHFISKNGIQTDSKKVEAIQKWPIPTNVTEVRSFLGSTNYYWRFIKKYAQVVKPLYKLISGENTARKQNSIKWDPECQEAFDKLRESGLGAVLYQKQDGVKKVISYASQSLTKSEAKYPVHKLEFLCLKWAITD